MVYCFSCGAQLVPGLESAGSLRCHDCRDEAAPVRPDLVPCRAVPERPALTLVKTFPLLVGRGEPPPFAA